MSKMDLEELIDVIKKCSSREINLLRDAFETIYCNLGVPEEDMDSLKLFWDKLKGLNEGTHADAIWKENIKRFALTIEQGINRGIVHYT